MLEMQVTGVIDFSDEELSCGMPVSVQAERLREALAACGHSALCVEEVDLYGLVGNDLMVATSAVVDGVLSPFVILDGAMLCSGSVDTDEVLRRIGATAGRP